MNNNNVLTFPSSKKAGIITRIAEYIKFNNILDTRMILIDEHFQKSLSLMDLSNSSIENSVEWLEFFKLIKQFKYDQRKYQITDKGYEFFVQYIEHGKFSADFIYHLLLDVTMPYKNGCLYRLSDKNYRVFETMFKVFLYLDSKSIDFNCLSFDEVYYFKLNNYNYKNYTEIANLIIDNTDYSHQRVVTDYLFSVLELFGVLYKKKPNFYSLTDNFKSILKENIIMNLSKTFKLPVLKEAVKFINFPYLKDKDFISCVLKDYLFSGLSMSLIEQKYYKGEARGFIIEDILNYYGIDKINRGIYINDNYKEILEFLRSQNNESYRIIAEALDGEKEINKFDINCITVKGAFNEIYFGTPGCGKSTKVREDYEINDNIVTRVTFHPEYSNSDFIGQIIPKIKNEQVYYEFKEGPFSEALLKAFKNPTKKNVLIIEEINRGNASSIFGDIFQLLDRHDDGTSEFLIDNLQIKEYLYKNEINLDKIYIPSNLWIIATMNTSDQNVYTLDTAFKRRWRMHRIKNIFDRNNKLRNMYIPGTQTTWEQFVTSINDEIDKRNKIGLNTEDKHLGVYFVGANSLTKTYSSSEDASLAFAEKVLLYIWEDIAKLDRREWFGDNCYTFDNLLDSFMEKRLEIFRDIDFSSKLESIEDSDSE